MTKKTKAEQVKKYERKRIFKPGQTEMAVYIFGRRWNMNISQRELGRRIGIEGSRIWAIENGGDTYTLTALKIANFFGVSMNELVTGKPYVDPALVRQDLGLEPILLEFKTKDILRNETVAGLKDRYGNKYAREKPTNEWKMIVDDARGMMTTVSVAEHIAWALEKAAAI